MNKLTAEELIRYSRHLVLTDFGIEAQLKLKSTRVLVVGAGGLGCPVLLYLTAAGVGTIGIADFDVVQESNLQRQILFTTDDIGRNKSEAAVERLAKLNPFPAFTAYPVKLTRHNALEIITHYDLVIDGSDNFPTRYLVNDACVLCNKPLVYGAILQYEGQVAVFNIVKKDGTRSANYRDLFPHPPRPDEVPNCEEAGVLGVLPGIVGSLMANEAIKLLTGKGELLAGKLFLFDSQVLHTTTLTIPDRNGRNYITELIDYELFCGINQNKNKSLGMKEVTVQELKQMLDNGEDFQLIDVRESYENELSNLGGELIPMAEVPHNIASISKTKKVVIHCRSGGRSGNIIQWLEKNHGFDNLYNLKGGILAWAREIDPSLPVS
ncbi:MAG: ThiF family adenylyltransferase [Flammeovirgaceae bacterium]|nr:MAG: ThiF family adenylyltransferase [Flammeovirgaceae bacterium]